MSENNFKDDVNKSRDELNNFLSTTGRTGVLIAGGIFLLGFIAVAVFL